MVSEDDSRARCLGPPVFSRPGESKVVPSDADGTIPTRWAVRGGVLAGDDFCGEIDLARSTKTEYQQLPSCEIPRNARSI